MYFGGNNHGCQEYSKNLYKYTQADRLASLSLMRFTFSLASPASSNTRHTAAWGWYRWDRVPSQWRAACSCQHSHGECGTGVWQDDRSWCKWWHWKTFTLSHILRKVRAQGKVALATAASGIAATLLPKGTTFHSRTKCPIVLTDESTCNVNEDDNTAALIKLTHIMVVDEVSMMDRRALEAADRTFQWLRGSEKPFGGITMVFSGDWRQILTVVPHGSRTEIVGRCLKSSYLWREFTILRLTENMRIRQATGGQQDEADFATFLLNLGEGKIQRRVNLLLSSTLRSLFLVKDSKTWSVGCMTTSRPTFPTLSGYVNEWYYARPTLKLTRSMSTWRRCFQERSMFAAV